MSAPNGGASRLHAILNLRARGFRRHPELADRLRETFGAGAVVHATRDLAALDDAACSIARSNPSLVVLAGGDGTFMAGASALARHTGDAVPPLALLPLGTVGRLAVTLGIGGDPIALAARYAETGPDVHAITQPSLRARSTGSDGAERTRIGFIFGTGLVARFFDVYEERGAGGVADAARIVARTFASSLRGGRFAKRVLDPLPCRVEVDGRPLEPDAWSLVCAAVVRDLGLGMRVTYRAGEDPSRIHLVAHALPPSVLGPRVGRVLLGRTIAKPGERGHDDLVSSFTVRFDDEGPWVLDGDRFRDRAIEVGAGPTLRIAVP